MKRTIRFRGERGQDTESKTTTGDGHQLHRIPDKTTIFIVTGKLKIDSRSYYSAIM